MRRVSNSEYNLMLEMWQYLRDRKTDGKATFIVEEKFNPIAKKYCFNNVMECYDSFIDHEMFRYNKRAGIIFFASSVLEMSEETFRLTLEKVKSRNVTVNRYAVLYKA